jgi:hypothetical protein
MPGLALEDRLNRLCLDDSGERCAALDQDLARIRDAQRQNWTPILLTWFTDHTSEGHSRRIIELLGRAIGEEDLLTRNELFVLLAACYLHDLGMQDAKIDGRGIETMGSEAWNLIRERHPSRSRQLIIDRTLARLRDQFAIGLPPESDFLEPIALVAESHGSKFFEADIAELRERDFRPGNETARLAGVAALLLLGDELDLHRGRVDGSWPRDMFDLSAVGQLHFHLHHYVSRLDITRAAPSRQRRVSLRFTFPEDSDGYRAELKEWLARRLLRQIRRAAPVLQEEFDGALQWDDRLDIADEVTTGPIVRQLPGPAARHLAATVAGERLVDRAEIRSEITDGLAGLDTKPTIVGLRTGARSDHAYLLSWTIALAWERPVIPLYLDFTMGAGHDLLDLPEAVRSVLEAHEPRLADLATDQPAHVFDIGDVRGATTPDELANSLVTAVTRGEVILMLQGVSKTADDVREWCSALLERVQQGPRGFVLVVDTAKLELPSHSKLHRLNAYREKQIAAHLRDCLGYPAGDASREAEAVFQLGSGAPVPTLLDMLRRVTHSVEPHL